MSLREIGIYSRKHLRSQFPLRHNKELGILHTYILDKHMPKVREHLLPTGFKRIASHLPFAPQFSGHPAKKTRHTYIRQVVHRHTLLTFTADSHPRPSKYMLKQKHNTRCTYSYVYHQQSYIIHQMDQLTQRKQQVAKFFSLLFLKFIFVFFHYFYYILTSIYPLSLIHI